VDVQGSIVPATKVPLGGKTSNIKNNKWTFYTSIHSSSSSSSGATASLLESFGLLNYFFPHNPILDAIHQYQYHK
jgi:hypothetical protein